MNNEDPNAFGARLDALVPVIALTLDAEVRGDLLAGLACMSRYHFQRVFRRLMGETPGAFRRRLMLERAAYELGHGEDDITTIAFNAAYDSLEGFSRAFRRAYRLAPSRYRAERCTAFNLPAANG